MLPTLRADVALLDIFEHFGGASNAAAVARLRSQCHDIDDIYWWGDS